MIETEASKRVRAEDVKERRDSCRRVHESRLKPRRFAPATGVSPLLAWLNLACLDAPIVAVSWQWLFAKTFGVTLLTSNRVALFLTAWLIYLADRFADSIALRSGMPMSLRQRFCLRHRNLWMLAVLLVAIADLIVIALWLDSRTVAAGAALGLAAAAYLILNHWSNQLWSVVPAKEVLIGFLFAGGTIASLFPHFPPITAPFAITSFLFACLCSLNCMCIARWESQLDRAQNKSSLATAWPRIARGVFVVAIALAGVAIALSIFARTTGAVYFAISLSAVGLAALDRFGDRLEQDARTACADLVLLTPLMAML